MTYSILNKLELRHKFDVNDVGAILVAAVCHDVDHPGVNNSYHVNSQSTLAILYDYESVLGVCVSDCAARHSVAAERVNETFKAFTVVF